MFNATNPAVRFIERIERSRKVAGKKIHMNVAQNQPVKNKKPPELGPNCEMHRYKQH